MHSRLIKTRRIFVAVLKRLIEHSEQVDTSPQQFLGEKEDGTRTLKSMCSLYVSRLKSFSEIPVDACFNHLEPFVKGTPSSINQKVLRKLSVKFDSKNSGGSMTLLFEF